MSTPTLATIKLGADPLQAGLEDKAQRRPFQHHRDLGPGPWQPSSHEVAFSATLDRMPAAAPGGRSGLAAPFCSALDS